MPAPSDIRDPQQRERLEAAHAAVRARDAAAAVRLAAEALQLFLQAHPQYLADPAREPLLLQWPKLGCDLVVVDGAPRIVQTRTRFTVAEAITCYEYALGAIAARQP